MAKTLLLHAILLSCCVFANAQLIFKETFNGVSAPALPAGWTTTANWVTNNTSASNPVPPYSGGNNIRVRNCGPLGEIRRIQSPQISTVGFTNIVLSYGIRRTGAFPSGAIVTEYSINGGGTWNAITIGSAGSATWSTVSAALPAAVNNQADVRFRWSFTTTDASACGGGSPNFRIDDVTVARSNTLPITIDQFTALQEDKRIRLQWITSNQKSFSHFEIEASVNGNPFQTLEIIPAKRNDLNATEAYEYFHQKPEGAEIIYYRLKLVDENSSVDYSKTIQVKLGKPGFQIHSIYPVPVKDQLTFSWYSNSTSPARFTIIDVTGRIQINQTIPSIKGLNTTNFSIRNLPAGVFFLKIYIDQEVLIERFVKE